MRIPALYCRLSVDDGDVTAIATAKDKTIRTIYYVYPTKG